MARQQLRPGTAAVLRVGNGQSIAVVSEAGRLTLVDEALDVEPGNYVVVPVKLWEQTVRKAMMGAELTGEGVQSSRDPLGTSDVDDQLPPTRQQRRRAKFDA